MRYLLAAVMLLFCANLSAQVEVVKSFNSEGEWTSANPGSNPTLLTKVGNNVYFVANDGKFGRELWKTNGTEAGTVLLKNIVPGPGFTGISQLFDFNGRLVFVGNDAIHGSELWISDGTEAGTGMIKDLSPGLSDSFFSSNFVVNGSSLLFFASDEGGSTYGLYKTDGTEGGTQLIQQLDGTYDAMITIGNVTYFTVYGALGKELWRTDGLPNGTYKIIDISQNSNALLTNVNGTLYFTARSDNYENQLWKSNGTANTTVLVKTFTTSGDISKLTSVDEKLFFVGNDGELWKTDGTPEGTQIVNFAVYHYPPINLVSCNGSLFFTALDGNNYNFYKTNGEDSGTELLLAETNASKPISANNKVFFVGIANNDQELYVSDGTPAGSGLVKDIRPNASSSANFLTAFGQGILFSANDGKNGLELWISDGTFGGTNLLKNIYAKPTQTATQSIYLNNQYFFIRSDMTTGSELWKSDGTSEGTSVVKDINPGIASSTPGNFIIFNSELYFTAIRQDTGQELWKTNGTEAGTILVKDINPGNSSSFPMALRVFDNFLYFSAQTIAEGMELWKSDGIITSMVKDINPGSASSFPSGQTLSNGVIFFGATDNTGVELWKSDGTNTGTQRVKDINPNIDVISSGGGGYGGGGGGGGTISVPASSLPINFITVGNLTIFSANDGSHGTELWVTDGTQSGTKMVKDIYSGPSSSSLVISPPISYLTTAYFIAQHSYDSYDLWKTDGTTGGTSMIKNIPGSTSIFGLTEANGKLFFSVDQPNTGRELWVSDGTEEGTKLLVDAAPGMASSDPQTVFSFEGSVYFFTVGHEPFTRQLWKTDGNEETTKLIGEFFVTGESAPIIADNELYIMGTTSPMTPGLMKLDKQSGQLVPFYSSSSSEYNPRSFQFFNTNAVYFLHNDAVLRIRANKVISLNNVGPLQIGEEINLLTVALGSPNLNFSIIQGPGSIQNKKLKATASGTIVINVTFPGDATYKPRQIQFSIDVVDGANKIAQSIISSTVENKIFGDKPFTINATGGASGNPIIFSVSSGPATVENSKVSLTGAGTVKIIASQAGNNIYTAAPDATIEFSVGRAKQAIDFSALANVIYGSPDVPLIATGGKSQNQIQFEILSGPATINQSKVVINGTGLIRIKASQVGNNNYESADDAFQEFTVAKAMALITFENTYTVFDGTGKSILLSTTPANLPTVITYNEDKTKPINAGDYYADVLINDANYYGNAHAIFKIAKAPAAIALPNTSVTFNNKKCYAVASTNPAGVAVKINYTGLSDAPQDAGTYEVKASIDDPNYTGADVTSSLTINKAKAIIAIQNLETQYDGNNKSVSVITSPPDLVVDVRYGSNANAPINAGTYDVVVTVRDKNHNGDETALLIIKKAEAKISVTDVSFVFDGSSKIISSSTIPAGVQTEIKYSGQNSAPTQPGVYNAVVSITDPNYLGIEKSAFLTISKANAIISIDHEEQIYDGSFKNIKITTEPVGLKTDVKFNGTYNLPVNAGTYDIDVNINDKNYNGSKTEKLVISKAGQKIKFTPVVDKNSSDDPFEIEAISNSGLSLTYTVISGPGSVSGRKVTLIGEPGFLTIEALQSGSENYLATSACLTINISTNPVLGIKESNDRIDVWPNPASNIVTLKARESIHTVSIVDHLGRVIVFQRPENSEIMLNVSGYAPGNYILKVTTENSIITKHISILK